MLQSINQRLMNRKMSKLDSFNLMFEVLRFFIAVLLAFGITFIILFLTSDAPFEAMLNLFIGPLTSVRRFSTVFEMAIPLTFCGLGITVMFRANQFNLAVEGAFYLGALVMAASAIFVPLPSILTILVGFILSMLIGSLITAIPGYLKVKFKASELVISLMLNTVVLYLGVFVFNRFLRDQNSAYATSFEFQPGVNLGNLIRRTRMHAGIFIMILAVIVTYIFIKKTKWGFNITVTGSNAEFAKTVGINTGLTIILAQLYGGAVAGLGGAVEMIGIYTRFQWLSLPGYGFDGVVLHIIARGNPIAIPFAALLISYIRVGADYMYRQTAVAAEIVAIIEGLLIMLIAANAFLVSWKHRQTTRISTEAVKEIEHAR